MIVFPLLISSNIFSCISIKFVNYLNNMALLYCEISKVDLGEKFYNFLDDNNLVQLIAELTRVTCRSLTILDFVITNCLGRHSTSGNLSLPSNCDYSVILANMNIFIYRSRSYKRQVWNFNNVDSTNMNRELSGLDWISLCENIKTWLKYIKGGMATFV